MPTLCQLTVYLVYHPQKDGSVIRHSGFRQNAKLWLTSVRLLAVPFPLVCEGGNLELPFVFQISLSGLSVVFRANWNLPGLDTDESQFVKCDLTNGNSKCPPHENKRKGVNTWLKKLVWLYI